jgi:hypothetical protein
VTSVSLLFHPSGNTSLIYTIINVDVYDDDHDVDDDDEVNCYDSYVDDDYDDDIGDHDIGDNDMMMIRW